MTYQVEEAIEAARRLLYGSTRPSRNQLQTTITSTTTSVVYTHTGNPPAIGSLISIGQEVMYVWDKTEPTLTVSRGEMGTLAVAHTAGDVIEINSRFARAFIAAALQDEIRSWEPILYAPYTVSASTASWPNIVDAGVDAAYGVLAAVYQRDNGQWVDCEASLVAGLPEDDFQAGLGVSVKPLALGGMRTPASLRLTLAVPFDVDAIVNEDVDLVDDVGLARSMCDLAVWGAAIRLLGGADIARTDPTAQGQPRDATQVKVGDQSNVAGALRRQFNLRWGQEVQKLNRRFGPRF